MPDYSLKDITINFYSSSSMSGDPVLQLHGTAMLRNPNLTSDEQFALFEGHDAEDLNPIFRNLGVTSPITPYWYNTGNYLANYSVTRQYQPNPLDPEKATMHLIVTSFARTSINYNAIMAYCTDNGNTSSYADSSGSLADTAYVISTRGQGIYDLGWLIGESPLYLRVLYEEDEHGNKTLFRWAFSLYACVGQHYESGFPIPEFRWVNIGTTQNSYKPRSYEITDRSEEGDANMAITVPVVGSPFNTQYAMRYSDLAKIANALNDIGDSGWGDFFEWLSSLTPFTKYETVSSLAQQIVDNMVDICAFPFDVPTYCSGAEKGRLYLLMGDVPLVGTSRPDMVPFDPTIFEIYNVNAVIEGTGWTEIKRVYNDFRDYPPFTSYEVFIPFVGWKPLDVRECYGKSIKVFYGFDTASGDGKAFLCVSSVHSDINYQVLESYPVQFGIHFPISAVDWNGVTRANIMGTASLIGGAIATGASLGMIGGGTALIEGAKQNIEQLSGLADDGLIGNDTLIKGLEDSKLQAERGASIRKQAPKIGLGGVGGIVGGAYTLNSVHSNVRSYSHGSQSSMSEWFSPNGFYICRNEVDTDETTNLLNLYGYPSNKSGTISQFSGFLKVSEVKLDIQGATAEEKAELENLLKTGVYL